jgi:hypothetical protein
MRAIRCERAIARSFIKTHGPATPNIADTFSRLRQSVTIAEPRLGISCSLVASNLIFQPSTEPSKFSIAICSAATEYLAARSLCAEGHVRDYADFERLAGLAPNRVGANQGEKVRRQQCDEKANNIAGLGSCVPHLSCLHRVFYECKEGLH